ncbi:MAG: hypothetical protein JWM41_1024 [Gemmatimonadetes bacterium]|nr:hypothetical protein [Gemmatimonadota bacterium]
MLNLRNRARWAAAHAAIALPMLTGACDVKKELLDPQNPAVIDPSAVTTPAAADALRIGAFGRLKVATAGGESMWLYGGLLTDEWKSSDTFTQRNETDQRSVQTNNGNIVTAYASLQQSRGYIKTAIDLLNQYTPDSTRNIGQMYMSLGFAEMTIAQTFCNGVPLTYTNGGIYVYGPQLTTDSIYKLASFHLDSAVSFARGADAIATAVRQAALVARARVLVDMGQFAQAAALVPVSAVPTSFQYLLTFDQTSGDNNIWSLNNSIGRYSVSDSVDAGGVLANALPFASANDPRVPVIKSPSVKPVDGTTPLFIQTLWANRNDPVPLASGIDARLIEAEAKLNAADYAGMMTILNALRTTAQTIGTKAIPAQAALTTVPTTKDAAVAILFRERGFWTFGRGERLPDLRREVRLYGKAQDKVFPAGSFSFKTPGAVYGNDVNFPVTDNEITNPLFKGCIDRKA